MEAKNASEAAIKGQEYKPDIEGLVTNSVIAILFGTLEAFKATPGVPELQGRVKSGDPAAIKEATDFINNHADEIETTAKEQYEALKAPNTELNTNSNTIGATPLEAAGVTQDVQPIQTPMQAESAPQPNAEGQVSVGNAAKAETQSVVLKIRESIPLMDVDEPVSMLTGNEFSKGAKKLSEQVIDFFSKFGNKVTRSGFGDVVIDSESVGADIGHGIGRAKAITFASVPDVISRGVQIDYQQNWKGRGADSYVFAAPVDIGGNKTYVGAIVLSDGKNHFYLHEVVDANGNIIYIKNNDAGTIKTGVTVQDGLTSSPASLYDTNIAQNASGVNGYDTMGGAQNTSIPEGMGARSGSTYESLSDPRALKLLEQYNGNVPKTEAEKRAELARIYEELFEEQQEGKSAVEKDTRQGYNGNWDRLYDENVQGAGHGSSTAEGAGETFSPINPGTLSDEVASTFRSSTYTKRVLTEDTVFYRVYGGNAEIAGNYMSRTPQMGGLQSQLDLALVPEWGNTATYVTKVTVPKGTVIYEGFAAPQTINGGAGMIMGGGSQIYIPEARLNPSWFGN